MRCSFFGILLILFYNTSTAQEKISIEQVVALALERNYDIKLSQNALLAASTDDKYAPGAFLPTLNATGTRTWNNNNQKQELANGDDVERNGVESNNLTGSVQLQWMLFDGTRMFATRERISQIEEQGELFVKEQMVNTIAQVITNYHNIVRQKQQLRAIREQMGVSEERVKLASRRLEVGTGGKPELLQAKVDLNAQRTDVLVQQTLIAQLKDQLNGLVDMQLPSAYDVADTIVINLDLRLDDISTDIENRNYALLSAKKEIDIANLLLRERKGERYPFLYFNSALNYSKRETSFAINNFTPLFDQNKGYNYGFSFTFPILNGFNNRRLIQQARISSDRQTLLYQQQKVDIDVRLRNAFVNYVNAKEVLIIEEENILLAKENLTITLEIFKRGLTTFIELRTAQQSLADAYDRVINARFLAKVAETELLRLNSGLLPAAPPLLR